MKQFILIKTNLKIFLELINNLKELEMVILTESKNIKMKIYKKNK
jgi:hypothetical protein